MQYETFNLRDAEFLLYEWLQVESLCSRPRFAEHSRATFDAALASACAIAKEQFAPHNRLADEQEPHFDGTRVTIHPAVKPALDAFAAAGFIAACHDEADGGMQLPFCVAQACFAAFNAANVSTAAYPFLTMAAANLLRTHGSDEQRRWYLPALLSGRFFGTMVLTEPHAGSSLGDLRTSARPSGDGSYRLRGQKIFISAGEHDLAENIIHLVLARIEGAPAGTRGISLFLVPKFLLDQEGRCAERNDIRLLGLIHKLGYRGTTSTMLAFGENDRCTGYLVGDPARGLETMFHMMNEARIGIGLGAAMLGQAGYAASLAYARERPQGRAPGAKRFDDPQRMIIEHADVKRMLLAQKAICEGAFALCLYAARLVDERDHGAGSEAGDEARLLLDFLTPIVKAWPSQYCVEANSLAIQVMGGYGYTRDYPVEQYFRDNRLNPIHEGTNGIQAIDLLGRKLPAAGGAALQLVLRRASACAERAAKLTGLDTEARALGEVIDGVAAVSAELSERLRGDVESTLADAASYLDLLGLTCIAWMWLEQATIAAPRRDGADAAFYRGKLAAMRYFFRRELPRWRPLVELLQRADRTCLDAQAEWF